MTQLNGPDLSNEALGDSLTVAQVTGLSVVSSIPQSFWFSKE